MGYTPPTYRDLQKATNLLQQSFNRLSSRYIPPDYQSLRNKADKLKEKYLEKVKEKSSWRLYTPKPDPTRLDQIACIAQLLNNLPENPRDTDETNSAQCVLLGALFYRLLRIDYSYEGYSFFGSTEKDSALHEVIIELLSINEVANKLDAQTVATCCAAYRDYLKQEKVSEKYSYIAKDSKFFTKLKTIIDVAQINAKPVEKQLQSLVFIQSIAQSLETNDKSFLDTLALLSKSISNKLKSIESLNRANVIELMNALKPAVSIIVKQLIEDLLPPDLSINNRGEVASAGENKGPFQEFMAASLVINSKYTLLGAYVLSLSQCTMDTPHLTSALNNSIGVQLENQLDDEKRELALTALENFMELPGELKVDFKAWGGSEFMKGELTRQLTALKQSSVVVLI